jgi:glycosyltransferase involved in cell wall biosynthesis
MNNPNLKPWEIDMNFSLILNSRGRPNLLVNLLRSVKQKTHDLSKIEVLISCDQDDEITRQYSYLFNQFTFAKFEWIPRNTNLHQRMANSALDWAAGKYIFILNDDVEFFTDNWDRQAITVLDAYMQNKPDGIVYGHTTDNSCDKTLGADYSSFPIISRKAVEVLGFVMPTIYQGLGGDVITYRIYEAINRIVSTGVHLDHVLHRTVQQVNTPDMTNREMRFRTSQGQRDWETYDISEWVSKLKQEMES